MAADTLNGPNPPLDYGSSVCWQRGSEILTGSACGFREIVSQSDAETTGYSLGTVLILVEFPDGESIEIPLTELHII